ncbi:MAG: DUF1844 domain-containing protein [Candidatus Hydrogenedentes bacterium]|jgi:hypothetical protein|nr:DUF1844 domain-containing protein [Candidatus Hydrogenedentota bacterium]
MSDIKTNFYVDEDWKARVQRERESAALKKNGGETPVDGASSPDTDAGTASEGTDGINPYLDGLLKMLGSQAMYSLGLIGGQGQAVVDLDQAREMIEMIGMLREKMQGNLSNDEQALFSEFLAELHRLFTARAQQVQNQAMERSGVDMNNLRSDQQQQP